MTSTEYDIKGIRDGLDACQRLTSSPALADLRHAIEVSKDKLDEPMQLAVIGKISSSKSTLINAILGKDELMSTGQKEVTYNVGWLKYGSPDSDIIIHYKDGSRPERKSRDQFNRLSADDSAAGIDNISYIEIFDDAEILREINIIDTPGLDARREKDSQNTLDFISRVRPDAVVMLFTHAVAENTLDVVRQFNAGAEFSPLNAIGVLSKIDVLWQETFPRDKSALAIGSKMVMNRKKKDRSLARTLFDIYPVSSLLYLAAATVDDADIAAVTEAAAHDRVALIRSLNKMDTFLSDPDLPIAPERRRSLADKLGLYGIWLIAAMIGRGEDVDLRSVREMFLKESGAENFSKTLHNHFASRARLIKLESICQHLGQAVGRCRATARTPEDQASVSAVEQRISDIFASLVHEHQEYEMLRRLYDGDLILDNDVADEFRALCGENGNSAPEKLRVPAGTDVTALLAKAAEKERQWRRETALEPDPDERAWMNVILRSYAALRQQISTMAYRHRQAESFLFNR